MTSTRNPGRPKNPATVHREQEIAEVERILREVATRHPMSATEQNEMSVLIATSGQREAEILRKFHIHPMKKSYAYAMASLGDDSVEGYEEEITTTYEEARLRGVNARTLGTKSNKKSTADRKDQFFKVNAQKIDGMLAKGRSDSDIARQMCKPPLNKHGVSERTVRRWVALRRSGE